MEISKKFAAFSEYLNFKAGHSNLWTQFDNYNHSAPAELLLCEHSLQAGFVGNSTFSCHSVPDIWSRRICFCLFFQNQNKLRIEEFCLFFFIIKTNSEYMMTVHERFLHHPVVASTNRVYQHRPQTNPTVGNYAACKIYWDSVFNISRKSAQIGLTIFQDFDNYIFNTWFISSLGGTLSTLHW